MLDGRRLLTILPTTGNVVTQERQAVGQAVQQIHYRRLLEALS